MNLIKILSHDLKVEFKEKANLFYMLVPINIYSNYYYIFET